MRESTAPAASIHASASRTSAKALRADAEIAIHEPGAPTQLTVHVVPRGDASSLAFDLTSAVEDFDRVPQLGHAVRGSAKLDAQGSLDLGAMTLDATVRANAGAVAQGANRVRSAALDAHAWGAAAAPQMDVSLRALDVDAGGKHVTSAVVAATGETTRPHVTVSVRGPDTPDVEARGDLGLENGLSLRDFQVSLARAGEQARVRVASVAVRGEDIDIRDARIEGLGAPLTTNVALSPGRIRVRAKTGGVDLGRAGRLAHVEKSLKDSHGCDTCRCAPVDAGVAGSSSTTDADCVAGSLCGFPTADACTATGTCFVAPRVVCNAAPGCACDGSEVNILCNGLPGGYAPAPLLHTGACTGSGPAAGSDG